MTLLKKRKLENLFKKQEIIIVLMLKPLPKKRWRILQTS